MSKILKLSIIFILFISITIIVSGSTLATLDPSDFLISETNVSTELPTEVRVLRFWRILFTILTSLNIILFPVCITLGTIYLVKSKSKPAKKITLGVLIILAPIILFVLLTVINFIIQFNNSI